MSRFCGAKDITPILSAAEKWRKTSLIDGQSVFGLGEVWNSSAVDDLVTHYVKNLDYGEGNFTEKLEKQLESASREAKVLCAEIMWVMLLSPSNINPEKKRQNVAAILSWAGESLPDDESLLSDFVLSGIGSGGTAYNNLRWKELVYFIEILAELFSLLESERASLLEDGDRLALWLEKIPGNDNRQFRHMLLYLLFPDAFERIFGNSDRIKILKSFGGLTNKEVKVLKAHQVDSKLAEIRSYQEASFGTSDLDWYVPPLKALWQNTTKSQYGTENQSIYDTLITFLEQAQTEDLRTKDYPGSHAGLTLRISFGAGNQAHVPWIGMLAKGQSPTKGIYPAYLYYRAERILILAKCVSATNTPLMSWDVNGDSQTVSEYFREMVGKPAIRYGDSYVHNVYNLSEELDKDQIDADLADLIDEYLTTIGEEAAVVSEPEIPGYDSNPSESEEEDFSIDSFVGDVFTSRERLEGMLSLLRNKKNIVLQGPPGVGKSFLAKKLAYALMGKKSVNQVDMVQFHQSYAYEDFVQGYRPSDAGFELKNGLFHQFCTKAGKAPEKLFVFIIDEINRGNLSKIFGELMLLIEADKRGPDWSVPLTYSKDLGERFYIPENVHLIGLMNTADRSLSMVDYALRRRFAFVDLKPEFESEGFSHFLEVKGVEKAMITTIVSRMNALNSKIANDSANLGPGFCIGHSFFCGPSESGVYGNAWFKQVVEFEIAPLVREYWFDDPRTAQSLIDGLLA
ncbi:MrcB family domain-containing protein [Marinimicrobium alkaliphilum]|uniref:MrcB family domain-containing protein n=1 Tax=Marinimicrobium alkaliphilum TaxID=2202654 RepID=UPI000DB9184B|nr:AAA family ATPase [Marinimicrobium alkaliphilum]